MVHKHCHVDFPLLAAVLPLKIFEDAASQKLLTFPDMIRAINHQHLISSASAPEHIVIYWYEIRLDHLQLSVHFTSFVRLITLLEITLIFTVWWFEAWILARTNVCQSKFSVSLYGMWFASLASHVLVLYFVDDMPDKDCYSEGLIHFSLSHSICNLYPYLTVIYNLCF